MSQDLVICNVDRHVVPGAIHPPCGGSRHYPHAAMAFCEVGRCIETSAMHDAKAPQIKMLVIISHFGDDIVRATLIYDAKVFAVVKTP
jgi:hypothetical protein